MNSFVRNSFARGDKDGCKAFVLNFESVPAPSGFKIPEVNFTEVDGTKLRADDLGMSAARGMWYVNSCGYMRFYIAADLGLSQRVASDFLRRAHLRTLCELLERTGP